MKSGSTASSSNSPLFPRTALWFCVCMTLLAASVPFVRAAYRFEVNYNEGWNIYNAQILAQHGLLYPARYAWTSNNYPMVSFYAMALLHRWTHEYLFTARVVSLLALLISSLLVVAILRRLQASATASWLGGLFCLAVFCANADPYVGADDPQIFAQIFFLAGLWVFLWRRSSLPALAAAALLFTLGGFTKHNLVDLPLAVLIELCLVARLRAAWFAACGLLFAAIGVWLNQHFGGAFFLSQLLTPRVYVAAKVPAQFVLIFGPILLPFILALFTAFSVRKDPHLRIASILLLTTLVVGGYFGGGQGVSINCLFSAMLATSICIGLFLSGLEIDRWNWRQRLPSGLVSRTLIPNAPALLFAWLLIPLILSGNWNPIGRLRDAAAAQQRFQSDVVLLQSNPAPALCESLLLCYVSGKPYDYDPFNATRLIHFGKLDVNQIVVRLQQHQYGAVQLDQPLTDPVKQERFDAKILAAIQQNYTPERTSEDTVIYLPKTR